LFVCTVVFFCSSSFLNFVSGSLWSGSYGSWIYNYLYNQCLSPIMLWVRTPFMARCTRYNIMWLSLSVTCRRSVVFSTHKTDHHDITKLLLKVVLNTINQTNIMLDSLSYSFISTLSWPHDVSKKDGFGPYN
jgi:hypothetical protein